MEFCFLPLASGAQVQAPPSTRLWPFPGFYFQLFLAIYSCDGQAIASVRGRLRLVMPSVPPVPPHPPTLPGQSPALRGPGRRPQVCGGPECVLQVLSGLRVQVLGQSGRALDLVGRAEFLAGKG